MNIGSFSAHVPRLAYYIFIGTTNSAKNVFLEQLEAYFLPRTFFRKSYSIRSDEI